MKRIHYILAGIILIVTRIVYFIFFRQLSGYFLCGRYHFGITDLLWLLCGVLLILYHKKWTPIAFILTGLSYIIPSSGCSLDRELVVVVLGGLTFASTGLYLFKDYSKNSKFLNNIWFIPLALGIAYGIMFISDFTVNYFSMKYYYFIPIGILLSFLLICLPIKKH